MNILPRNDRIVVRRHPPKEGAIKLTDADRSLKGTVLAVGPGKRDEDGDIEPLQVKPGDTVLFSSKWNDLAGDYYSDLPVGADPLIHLIQEADILAIL